MRDLKYLTDSYDEKIAQIKEINAPLNFLFITDIHNRNNYMIAQDLKGGPYELAVNAIDSMHYILERCPEISFLVCGGDVCNDYYPDPIKTRESFQEAMDALYRLPIPVHCCVGNHDDAITIANMRGRDTVKAAILPDEMHRLCMKYNPTSENYYYVDVDTKEGGWRMIFLNTSDKPYFLKDGKYPLGWDAIISMEQIAWFEKNALVTDRNIIVFSHIPLNNEGIYGMRDIPYPVMPYNGLFGGPRVYYDAKQCQNVQMLIAGHVHFDNMVYDYDILSVTSLGSLTQEWTPNGPKREYGTPTETAFEVFSIKGDMVYITRFGAGDNRMARLMRMEHDAAYMP